MSMLPPAVNAMMSGVAQGDQMAQSILPNAYQPQGKPAPQNPWQGAIDLQIDQLLSLGRSIKEQGDEFRAIGDEFFGIAYKLGKLNKQLTDSAQNGSDSE